MPDTRIAPYGSWMSPIAADLVAAAGIRLEEVAVAGDDAYWVEARPAERGCCVLMHWAPGGEPRDVLPAPWSVRSRVHEYGGGALVVDGDTIVFSNADDGRLYRLDPGVAPRPLTPEASLRYADGAFDRRRNRLICVREDHTVPGHEPASTLVALDLATGGAGEVLAAGHDFYSTPRLSPDGTHLAWLAWDHPNMPWDGCGLWLAEAHANGSLGPAELVAGGPQESIFQPAWSPAGVLHWVSDRTGWWNLYRLRAGRVEALCPKEAEFGVAQWVFGVTTYAFLAEDRIACAYVENGTCHLGLLNATTGALQPLALPFTEFGNLHATGDGHLVFTAGSPTQSTTLVRLDPASGAFDALRASCGQSIPAGYLSAPQPIAFATSRGERAYGLYYPPRNPDYVAPEGELPPLIVRSHGGPTDRASSALDLRIQYWTSRGFAWLDVNYRGSTGYGRAYREQLCGNWGIVDVDDCVYGARELVSRGLADGRRLIARGGSAGGYTTLCALTFHDAFGAGASYYGIGDLETLASDTHKFEARYLDGLVGPYPARRDLYYQRSPIHFTDQLSCPVIFFQGLDDPVVPPNQAEAMVGALRLKGLPVAYVAFAGEGHGFRRAEDVRRSLEAELYFYGRVFGIALAERIEPVEIENLS